MALSALPPALAQPPWPTGSGRGRTTFESGNRGYGSIASGRAATDVSPRVRAPTTAHPGEAVGRVRASQRHQGIPHLSRKSRSKKEGTRPNVPRIDDQGDREGGMPRRSNGRMVDVAGISRAAGG